jgi:hypothetical protein
MSENSVVGISGFQRFSSAAPLKPVSTNQKCSTFYKEDPCELGEQVIDAVSIYLQLEFSKGSAYLSPISTKFQLQRISQRPFSGRPLKRRYGSFRYQHVDRERANRERYVSLLPDSLSDSVTHDSGVNMKSVFHTKRMPIVLSGIDFVRLYSDPMDLLLCRRQMGA